MYRAKYLLFFFLFIHYGSFGQILDDSTKQVYGPKSTEFILEADVFKNKKIKYHPDTLIGHFFRTDAIVKSGWLYQDLGNNGTASRPILFTPRENLYTETGFMAFDLYSPKTKDFRYYNTKSPYTNMAYVQGFKGFSNLTFTHSQNVNQRLNFTLDIDRINASKQYATSTSEDKLVDHWNYSLSSNYTGKKEKYTLLAVFYHLNHLQHEQGGVQRGEVWMNTPDSINYDYRLSYQAKMNGATSSERWNNLHIYHQYKLANGFQAFHVFDMERKKHFYNDNQFQANKLNGVYPDTLSTLDTLRSNIRYRAFGNRFGFKGRLRGFDYQAYLTHRLYDLKTDFGKNWQQGFKSEFIAGAQAAYYLNDSTRYVFAEANLNLDVTNPIYNIKGELHWESFIAGIDLARNPVYLIHNRFYNPALSWENDFNSPSYIHIRGEYGIRIGDFVFRPIMKYTLMRNYIYLDQKAEAQQQQSPIHLIDAGGEIGYVGRVFSFTNQLFFNVNSDPDVIRIPTLMNNTNVMFRLLYAKVLRIHIGADFYYKRKYLADAYMPVSQQFYLQDTYKAWGYIVAEPFLAFNIKRVKLALKYGNAGFTNLWGNRNYFTTPFYPGMRSAFYLKVEWPLFD